MPQEHSISWSVQPQKKSINFGIFKHPGMKDGLTAILPTTETTETPIPLSDTDDVSDKVLRTRSSSTINVEERLEGLGLKKVSWRGRCAGDKVAMGQFDVQEGQGGAYAMVFDNTFSKQTSKTINFVLMTHPTNAVPKSGHHLHYANAFPESSTRRGSGSNSASALAKVDSNGSDSRQGVLDDPRPSSRGRGIEIKGVGGATFFTGVLQKKRRKKGQGYAKRFFSLDFTSSTLSYYRDRHSSGLRGAVPLSLAAIGANEKAREFSIDSGAELWLLKALNKKDFEGWRHALERASAGAVVDSASYASQNAKTQTQQASELSPADEQMWARVEQLVSRVAGSRDAVRGLAKDTDPKYLPESNGTGLVLTTSRGSSNAPSPASYDQPNPYFPDMDEKTADKRPSFWRRKTSDRKASAERNVIRRSVSAQLAVPTASGSKIPPAPMSPGAFRIPKRPSISALSQATEADVHERCMALLRDLDNVVSEFATLVAESKARRRPKHVQHNSRMSLDSIDDQEFFDAEDGMLDKSPTQLLNLGRSDDFTDAPEEHLFDQISDADSDSSGDDIESVPIPAPARSPTSEQPTLFLTRPDSLAPLPFPPVTRRSTIQPPKQAPPSIIGFLRKNAGKDLSTVSMPVTANESTSLLQRLAESMEYSHLLDSAASPSLEPTERLAYITAFAISYFANSRVKERALRKPFNPLLGETYELIREDLGFRFVAEKISHHPVRMACQAESLTNGGWSFTQSPQPVQKFWGKSVELNTEGRVRVVLHAAQEQYSWSQATCFLRNVIAGEKYVEPVQSMTVINETSGLRAVATFKAGGMFSGRSEEVSVLIYDGGTPTSLGLVGKWTEGLERTDTGETLWSVGALVPDAPKVYGFTALAATLNEVTEAEDGRLPPTDSRLRPDQQALERGDIESAETIKAQLEERQRARRKAAEASGEKWTPRFFEKVEQDIGREEEVWRLKEKKRGYWERRERGDWAGVENVFDLS